MNDFTTEILKTLANKGDLNELFRVHLEKAVNTLLKTELTAFLDYEKYDRIGFNTGNSRNGSYDRTVKTEYGELHLQIPRDRNGEFKQQTVPAYRRTNDTLEETVIHLFRKGITMSEIADLIEKMYGHHYTPQTMSNMTKVLTEEVNAFKVRTLNDKYVAIFMDATYIPLKRQTVSKKQSILPLVYEKTALLELKTKIFIVRIIAFYISLVFIKLPSRLRRQNFIFDAHHYFIFSDTNKISIFLFSL